MAYVYGLFYEDEEEEDNICFYIGSGKNYRKDRHFMNWNLENGNNEDKKKIIKRKNDKKLEAKTLKENLTLRQARRLEEKLLNRKKIWKRLTNMKQRACGFGEGKNNTNYGGLSKEHKQKIGKANSGKQRTEEEKIKFSKNAKHSRDKKVVAEVKWLCKNTDLYQKEISNKYGISEGAVSGIANENSYWYVEPEKPESIPEKTVDRNKERTEKHKNRLALSNTDLTKSQVREIRWLYEKTDMSQRDISEKYPTSRRSVGNIVNQKSLGFIEGKVKPE